MDIDVLPLKTMKRHLYTIHQTTPEIIYRGVVESTATASMVLLSLGINIAQSRVSEIVNGKRWSNKVIVIKHEVHESQLITPELLEDLKFDGTRSAERLLRERKLKK